MKCFLDSSAIFAWADASSPHAETIDGVLRERTEPLVSSNLVFAETLSLVTKRIGKSAGIKLGDNLLGSRLIHFVFVDAALQRDAWAFFKKYKDKDFDFIDAASFVICRKFKIENALTLDRHFSQVGIKSLLL